MKQLEIKEVTTGWKVKSGRKNYYVGAYEGQGVIYRDSEAFDSGKGVCYIPEYDFDNREENETKLFEFGAKEAVSKELAGNPYISTTGYTRQDFDDLVKDTPYSARELFESCDWQHPETLIDEWENYREEDEVREAEAGE